MFISESVSVSDSELLNVGIPLSSGEPYFVREQLLLVCPELPDCTPVHAYPFLHSVKPKCS